MHFAWQSSDAELAVGHGASANNSRDHARFRSALLCCRRSSKRKDSLGKASIRTVLSKSASEPPVERNGGGNERVVDVPNAVIPRSFIRRHCLAMQKLLPNPEFNLVEVESRCCSDAFKWSEQIRIDPPTESYLGNRLRCTNPILIKRGQVMTGHCQRKGRMPSRRTRKLLA